MTTTCLAHLIRRVAGVATVALLSPAVAVASSADNYPNRRLEVILPYAAGGGVDAMARAFSNQASRLMGQSWVVVNRPGGGGTIGFAALANAKPDGYTIVFSPASALTNAPFLINNMPFDIEQIEPVCQVFENVFSIAVTSDSPISSVNDLIQAAKSDPGSLSYGHAGPGSVPHLSVAALEKELGIELNGVGYRGDGQMLPDLIGGHLDFGAPAISSLSGQDLNVLAVLAENRHPALPDVPSMTDLGLPATTPGLNGLYVPVGTPEPIIRKLESACEHVVKSEAFTEAASRLQQAPAYLPADAFKARLKATYDDNESLMKGLDLQRED